MAMKNPVSVARISNTGDFLARIKGIGGIATYVGIPAASPRSRTKDIRERAAKFVSGKKKSKATKKRLKKIAKINTETNAQLLHYFSKGSVLRKQPPRPVLEPAIHADGNKQEIAALVAEAINFEINGQHYESKLKLKSAGARAAKAARQWFTDPRNGWADNAFRTQQRKGRNSPGLDTEIMRRAITHVEREI